MPDPELGQRVGGFVQLADSAQSVDLNEILAFATKRLADYKVPETLEIIDHIPRCTLGKIDRRLLLTMIPEWESRSFGPYRWCGTPRTGRYVNRRENQKRCAQGHRTRNCSACDYGVEHKQNLIPLVAIVRGECQLVVGANISSKWEMKVRRSICQ